MIPRKRLLNGRFKACVGPFVLYHGADFIHGRGEFNVRNQYREAAEHYTKAEIKAAHDTALKVYIEENGQVTNKTLARRAKVPASWISKWEKDENWKRFLPGGEPGDKMTLSKTAREEARKKGPELTEQEWRFCYAYYKTRNPTQAALNSGYHTGNAENGYRLLRKPEIQEAIRMIGDEVCQEIKLEACDIVNMWAKIAFADMNDYVKVSSAGVFLKPSTHMDGQVIQEVKEGRDGVTIKLADRMKALDRLSEYLGVTPGDKLKRVMADKAMVEEDDNTLTVKILGV